MMVLADTSIWIDHFRRSNFQLAQFLDRGDRCGIDAVHDPQVDAREVNELDQAGQPLHRPKKTIRPGALALKDALTLPLPLDPLLEPEVELPGGETVTVLDTYTVLAALAGHMLRWLVNVITMTWPSASGARHAASTTRPNTGDISIDRKKKRRRSSKGG